MPFFFKKTNQPLELKIVQDLAKAYRIYDENDWNYNTDAGLGSFYVDDCLNKDRPLLKDLIIFIGRSLVHSENDEDSRMVINLFKHLYLFGFRDGVFKDSFRESFIKSLRELGTTEKSIEKFESDPDTLMEALVITRAINAEQVIFNHASNTK